MRGKWTIESILAEISRLYNENEDISSGYCQKNRTALYLAAKRHIGSWKEAIELTGIDYSSIRKTKGYKKWTKELVISNLQQLNLSGTKMNQRNIKKTHEDLIHACSRLFGSFKKACIASGIDYEKHYKGNKLYTEEIVLNEIQILNNKGESLSSLDIKYSHGGLYTAAINRYGTWANALEESGLDYNKIRKDLIKTSGYGFIFESILKSILLELEYKDTGERNKQIQPDFTTKNKRWFDAKLSEWSIHQCDTVKKYEPHCRMLTIIFLRGNPTRDEMITRKTRILSVYKLIKQLPNHRQMFYHQQLNNLQEEINEVENSA